jgi:hypothetical protein
MRAYFLIPLLSGTQGESGQSLADLFNVKKSSLANIRIYSQSERKPMTNAQRLRQLLSERFNLSFRRSLGTVAPPKSDVCEDRCLVHPVNRYPCGRARARDTCSDLNCCWDPDSELCYKQVYDYCPRNQCEQIHPEDRRDCSVLGSGDFGAQKCQNAGCCYDSFNKQCYNSSPKNPSPIPDTSECLQVKLSDRQSCGYGLSREQCQTMTGCCWRVEKDSSIYCYKSALQMMNVTEKAAHVTLLEDHSEQFEQMPPPMKPIINLKMANTAHSQQVAAKLEPQNWNQVSKASKKFQIWLSYISTLTQRIETACKTKTKPLNCIQAAANVLLVANHALLSSRYGLSEAKTSTEAMELLEGINDVLRWYCLREVESRFCRTVMLSGFVLNTVDLNENKNIVFEANARFNSLVKLAEFGMFGIFRPQHSRGKSSSSISLDCRKTFLLMQVDESALSAAQTLDFANGHQCQAGNGCWKNINFRDAIVDLFGEYRKSTKSLFVKFWRESFSPLLAPPNQPLLSNEHCFKPLTTLYQQTKELFDARLDVESTDNTHGPKKNAVP